MRRRARHVRGLVAINTHVLRIGKAEPPRRRCVGVAGDLRFAWPKFTFALFSHFILEKKIHYHLVLGPGKDLTADKLEARK